MAGVSKENKAKKSANKRSERKKRTDLKNRLMTSHGRQESEVQDESIWRHINLPEILRQQQMRYNFSELQVAALNYVLTNLLPLLEDTTQGNLPLIYPLPNGSEYREVAARFMDTLNSSCEIMEIVKVNNPYVQLFYELKKIQTMWKYGTVSEKWLFHGTKEENIYGICQNNFNWRLCKKHKYGMGVNFAPFSSYAAHYCDKTRTKVMVLSRVIIGNSCFWTKTMPWPLEPYDTVISGGRNVVVKFDDHSFYPDYLIYFRK